MLTLQHLEDWQDQYFKNDKTTQALRDLVDIDAGSPVYKAIWDTFDKYTETLAALAGTECAFECMRHWEVDLGMGLCTKYGSIRYGDTFKTLQDLHNTITNNLLTTKGTT